jgi:integrase
MWIGIEALVVEHAGRRDGPRTKSGKSRRVGLRPLVRAVLLATWTEQGRPDSATVFLNRRGKPYADTRQTGGNPLTSAYRTAYRKAGITGFRIHDWRHHFAVCRLVFDAHDPAIRRVRAIRSR